MIFTVFTPIGRDSEIARSTADLTDALLSLGHEVVLISTERAAPPEDEREPRLPSVAPWQNDEVVSHLVGRSDIVLHQLGHAPGDHVGSLRWLPELGGCVALHSASYDALAAERTDDSAGTTTFVEWIAAHADAVLAPSDADLDDVLAAGLPFAIAGFPLPDGHPTGEGNSSAPMRRTDGGPLRVLVVANDESTCGDPHADDAIVAVATDRALRERVSLDVLSALPEREDERLRALASDLGVRVAVSDGSDPHSLGRLLGSTDVSLHLSAPDRRAVPPTLFAALSAGVPAVTIRTGFGSTLDGQALLVDAADLVPELLRVLREIDAGRHDLPALAANAQARMGRDFGIDRIVDALVSVGAAAAVRKPLRELDDGFPVYRQAAADSGFAALFEEDTRLFRP